MVRVDFAIQEWDSIDRVEIGIECLPRSGDETISLLPVAARACAYQVGTIDCEVGKLLLGKEMIPIPSIQPHDIEGDGNTHVVGLEGNGAVIEIGREQHHQAIFGLDQAHAGLDAGKKILRRAAEFDPAAMVRIIGGDDGGDLRVIHPR